MLICKYIAIELCKSHEAPSEPGIGFQSLSDRQFSLDLFGFNKPDRFFDGQGQDFLTASQLIRDENGQNILYRQCLHQTLGVLSAFVKSSLLFIINKY